MNGTEPSVTIIDCLRHGETDAGAVYAGATDPALSDRGWQQMRRAVAQWRGDWDHILTSPLQRCHAFAQALAQARNIPLEIVDGLREIHFGDWEGQLIEDVQSRDPEQVANYYSDPVAHTPPGGEALEQAMARVTAALSDTLELHHGKRLLLVAHGGSLRLLMAHWLTLPLASLARWQIPHACASRVCLYQHGSQYWPSLVYHNAQVADEQ